MIGAPAPGPSQIAETPPSDHVSADIVVVIPAKNEAATIADVVAACRPYASEVLVIDGASHDGTGALAAGAGARVIRDEGRGKGLAIRAAVNEIRAPIAVFVDADGSHDPRDIPRLVEPIRSGAADHVSASRLMGGSSELHGGFDEFCRLAGSSFITACINTRYQARLSDTQNGFRAIRTELLRRLRLRERITTIEQELIVETLRAGGRMAEAPSHEHRRRSGRSHIRVARDAPRYLISLARLLLRSRRR